MLLNWLGISSGFLEKLDENNKVYIFIYMVAIIMVKEIRDQFEQITMIGHIIQH